MDGQAYAVAEYENQLNHSKHLKPYKTCIRPMFATKGGAAASRLPLCGASIREMLVFRLLGFLLDFVDFHILPQHISGHPFCNLKGWLGII